MFALIFGVFYSGPELIRCLIEAIKTGMLHLSVGTAIG